MARKLNFVAFPGFAPGHMIPMIDFARMLARHGGVTVTILITAANAERFRAVLDRERMRGANIRERVLRLPLEAVGLPEGCENMDSLPPALAGKFMAAVAMLRPQVEEVMRTDMDPPASCIVSDISLTWTLEIASGLRIPRFILNTSCSFSYYFSTKITDSGILGEVDSDMEPFTLPGTPHNIQLCRAQVKESAGHFLSFSVMRQILERIAESMRSSYGVISNSFDELEADYIKELKNMFGGKAWAIGPVCLCNEEYQDQVQRGNNNKNNDHILEWLDLQAPRSTIYVSFGSIGKLKVEQMVQLALGLESSKRPFILVLGRKDKEVDDGFGDWVESNGFEERNKGRGVLLRGWAPQVLILSHPSIGGFLTHCGWNSALESISIGVPMLTWPLFAEQFLNEKLVVELLGIGVSIGWKGDSEIVLKKDEIKEAIDKLMDEEDEDAIERRRKVKEFGQKANFAIQKDFGSSYLNMIALIQDVSAYETTN